MSTAIMSHMDNNDVNNIDVDDFFKAFTNPPSDSPARPTMMGMANAHHYANHTHSLSTDSASPFENYVAETQNAEWLHPSLDVLGGVSSPSSRGSSLETPNLPQNGFMPSIDPLRLKEINLYNNSGNTKEITYGDSNDMASPVWINQTQDHFNQSVPVHVMAEPTHNVPRKVSSSKRKRQGSLPEIYIPVTQPPATRHVQRSMSSSGIHLEAIQTDVNSPFMSNVSPVAGPMSAPALPQHPQSFTYVPPAPQTSNAVSNAPVNNGANMNRAFNYSSLETIPEAPASAPANVQWTPMQHSNSMSAIEFRNTYAEVSTYSMPQAPVKMESSVSPMPPITPQLPAHMAPPRPPVAPSLPHSRSTSLNLGNVHQQHQHQQQDMSRYPAHMSHHTTLSAGHIGVGMGRPVLQPQQPAHMRRSSDSELAFSMGQPGNVSAMLRSTSVPQVPGQNGHNVYGQPPPAPVATPQYQVHGVIMGQYGEPLLQTNPLGHGPPPLFPNDPPPRRRVTKRVGTCLKPGPKVKNKPRSESVDLGSHSQHDSLSGMSNAGDDVKGLFSVLQPANTCAAPPPGAFEELTLEQFCNHFQRSQQNLLVLKPGVSMEMLADRLMYGTPEKTVDACFRWCYATCHEFNKAAEKQTKYFKCCFEECAGSAGRVFMRKSAVDSHVRTHVGYRPFRCEADPECDARFVRKHDRDRHVATTHKNEKSFLCDDCGQNFARSDALLRHRAKRDACKARIAI